jgi:hypothetical protein
MNFANKTINCVCSKNRGNLGKNCVILGFGRYWKQTGVFCCFLTFYSACPKARRPGGARGSLAVVWEITLTNLIG